MRNRTDVIVCILLAAVAGYLVGARRTAVAEASSDQLQALLRTDREFDKASARGGAAAWASFFAEDGMMMPAGGDIVTGRDKIQQAMSGAFSTPGFSLRWEPVGGAASGDLGYTYGVYKSTRIAAEGKAVTSHGKYVTIWRREGGAWKAVVDIGNSSPAPQKKEP